MRRVSLLAAASAGLSVGVLVVAGIAAGAASGRPAVAGLLIAAGVLAGFGLAVGWRPALTLSAAVALGGGVLLTGTPTSWVGLGLVGGAVAVSHEAARVSLDLRRPSRLGPGVLFGLGRRTTLVLGAAPLLAVSGAAVAELRPPGWLVAVALVLAAVPIAVPAVLSPVPSPVPSAVRSAGPSRAGRLRSGDARMRGAIALVVTVTVLAGALLGAAARQHLPAGTAIDGSGRGVADDAEPVAAPPAATPTLDGDRAPARELGGSFVNVALVVLAAALAVLLLAGLRRNQIPLDTEPVDVGPDDPGLDLVAVEGAQLDDETVTLDDGVAAAVIADITVDLRSEPDPGRAVRYAYARVEQRLGVEGVTRRISESEPEFLIRALAVLGDDGGAMGDLTALFERARFSESPVPEAMRSDALAALERLRRRLETTR